MSEVYTHIYSLLEASASVNLNARLTAEAIEYANKMKKIKKAEALRYKKAALASMRFEDIQADLNEISEVCGDIQYTMEEETHEKLLVALDGNDDELFEFKMAFADLDAMCEHFNEQLYETDSTTFDDTLVALVGRKVKLLPQRMWVE